MPPKGINMDQTAVNTTAEVSEKEESSEELQKKLKKSERSVKKYEWLILRLLIILVIIWVLFFVIIGLTHMPSGDMYPRVDSGDLVLFYRLDKDVKAQDIIVINKVTPDSNGKKETFILRVVAVEGDTVEIKDNSLIINGNAVVESNIFYNTTEYDDNSGKSYVDYPITLGEGQCFVLADYRNGGEDSRYFGPVDKSEILGTVITILRRNNL